MVCSCLPYLVTLGGSGGGTFCGMVCGEVAVGVDG